MCFILIFIYLGCCVTRVNDSGLDLICKKWSHSLVEIDLSWSTNTNTLDAAVFALSEQGEKSMLRYYTNFVIFQISYLTKLFICF